MKITPEQIEQVRDATNIVDLVGETVTLKKRGTNWLGLCPFHNEKTPSFNVRDDKGIFKCFGCGKGGDAFAFVMELEHLTFPDAVKRLAERANIPLEDATEEEKKEQSEKERVLGAVRSAAGWYYRALREPIGAEPLTYLRRRGLGDAILKKFGVGYAPDMQGAMIKAVQKKGYDITLLEKGGVVAHSQGRDWYERFRGRIIFPVFSATGRIIGFGGRIYTEMQKEANLAKYINSPDTDIYHKSQVLYGLFQAKDAIRKLDGALIVEGYADVIALHQAGFENSVAASGTSLTKDQLELLRRFTQRLTLIFDADLAGRNATERGIELALQAGFDVNIVLLKQGEDPDSIIRKFGADRFADALKNSESFIETKTRWFEEQGALEDPAKAAGAVKAIVQSIAKIPDALKREFFIRKLAGRFRLTEPVLNAELDKQLRRGSMPTKQEKREALEAEMLRVSLELNAEARIDRALSGEHRVLLQAVLADPEGVCQHFKDAEFEMDVIDNETVRAIITHIRDLVDEGVKISESELLAHFQSDEVRQRVIIECSISDYRQTDHLRFDAFENGESKQLAVQMARQSALKIIREQVEARLRSVKSRLGSSESSDSLTRLLVESSQLSRRLEALRNLSEPIT